MHTMVATGDRSLADLTTERLEAQICAMAGRRAADECAWLLLIAEFDRREGWAVWECRSTAYWLSWHCGLSLVAGRERVRVGRALEHLPRVRAEFAAGRLTYSKVRAITRVATPANERSLVELGLAATAAQLEQICAAYRSVQPANGAHQHLDEGACRSSASAEAPRPTRVDGLVELARSYLTQTAPSPRVERRHLLMLVDVGELTATGELGIDPDGRCTLGGRRISPETARRLGCSASMTTVLIDHRGLPLSVGRRSRYPTPAQRLALHLRDGGQCRYPGCSSRHVDAHHIIDWDPDGLTDLDNLVLLCTYHHHLIHRLGFGITLDPTTNTVEVRRTDGTVVTHRIPDLDDAPDRSDVVDDTLQPGEAGTRTRPRRHRRGPGLARRPRRAERAGMTSGSHRLLCDGPSDIDPPDPGAPDGLRVLA